jgi:hypothetical protein
LAVVGCDPYASCKEECDDEYTACIDGGMSEGACKQDNVSCERACKEQEMKANAEEGEE